MPCLIHRRDQWWWEWITVATRSRTKAAWSGRQWAPNHAITGEFRQHRVLYRWPTWNLDGYDRGMDLMEWTAHIKAHTRLYTYPHSGTNHATLTAIAPVKGLQSLLAKFGRFLYCTNVDLSIHRRLIHPCVVFFHCDHRNFTHAAHSKSEQYSRDRRLYYGIRTTHNELHWIHDTRRAKMCFSNFWFVIHIQYLSQTFRIER